MILMDGYSLFDYLSLLEKEGLLVSDNIVEEAKKNKVSHISYSSNDIISETLFVCKGAHFQEEYLMEALDQGACAYVSEKKYLCQYAENKNPYIIVNDIRKAMAVIGNFFYGEPWRHLNIIGITGTKGKSTTAYFMKSILDDYLEFFKKAESGIISGIDNYDGITRSESHLTTPEAFSLHQYIYNAISNHIEYMTMEVSSQGLKYHRTLGITYDVACFLNLGKDHISDIEHKDMTDYGDAKKILFTQCKNVVVNLDSDFAFEVIKTATESNITEKIFTFTTTIDRVADLQGYNIGSSKKGIRFRAKCDSFDEEFNISIGGLFNVSNALAAIAMAYLLHIPIEFIKSGLKKAKISGRMELFTNKKGTVTVLVDYAHNQMSFQSLFASIEREYIDKKIIIVYGCPGGKAVGRRKELGEITGAQADMSIITEEDSGEEAFESISEEIAKYIKAQGGSYEIIPHRGQAIKRAIYMAERDGNAIVLITGKGRETRQKRGTKYIDTPSDVDYVNKYLL